MSTPRYLGDDKLKSTGFRFPDNASSVAHQIETFVNKSDLRNMELFSSFARNSKEKLKMQGLVAKKSSCDANKSSIILSVNYHPQDAVTDRADMQQVARTPPRECVGRTALDQCSQKGPAPGTTSWLMGRP